MARKRRDIEVVDIDDLVDVHEVFYNEFIASLFHGETPAEMEEATRDFAPEGTNFWPIGH
ncbi:MAG: hypothetical protein GXP44_00800 [bacterium]|nr:hypothetical protein [bacterium]